MWSLDPAVRLLLRAGLAVLLASAAAHKLRDLQAFRAAVAAYDLVPGFAVGGLSVLLIGSELLFALALMVAGSSPVPSLGAAALLLAYTSAIAINLKRGRRDIDCGCAGPLRRQRLRGGLVARNLVLLSAALASALPAAARTFVWIDLFTLVSGLAASCLLYKAVDALLAGEGTKPLQRDGARLRLSRSV
jgi:hypothetical protein